MAARRRLVDAIRDSERRNGKPRRTAPPEREPTPEELPLGKGKATGRGWPEPIPASKLAADSGANVDWLLSGYLARGSVTLLTALWKSGKSTWLAHVLKSLGTGEPFAGRSVQAARALVLSEESQGLWAERRDRIGIGDHALFLCRPFLCKPPLAEWSLYLKHLADVVKREQLGLVIVDTLMAFLPCDDENDAAKMQAALAPLHALTEAGAAVLLAHHPKKGDASEGQASRGSGALPGFVDIIIEMRRASPGERQNRQRVLTSYSRYDATPPELVIELGEDGEGYSALGCRADADRQERWELIRDALPGEAPGWTVEELLEHWPEEARRPGRRTVADDLAAGAGKHWSSTGQGKRGDPFRFYRNSFLASPPPRGGVCKKGNGDAPPRERDPGEES